MTILKSRWGSQRYLINPFEFPSFEIEVSGRLRWALEALKAGGSKGCTPIETPGPRWSHYIHQLRALGVPIETINERHYGPFPGTHARYVLKAAVARLDDGVAA